MTNVRSAKQLEAAFIECLEVAAQPANPDDFSGRPQRDFICAMSGALRGRGLSDLADKLAIAADMAHLCRDTSPKVAA
ncbi:hypothetical protein [Burkholderia sp. 22PA0106]|uniref:hypothetical protein n=1 Tax=Burkholderia sp. 22PA0106 TaxID=3237371 RepID=UPI0039C1D8E3